MVMFNIFSIWVFTNMTVKYLLVLMIFYIVIYIGNKPIQYNIHIQYLHIIIQIIYIIID